MVAPYISGDGVGAVLASLIHAPRRTQPSGLDHLLLVDLLVTAPEMPASEIARDYALRELLVTEIIKAANEQWIVFQLNPFDEAARIDEAKATLRAIGQNGAHELVAWSVLYYRYVHSEFDFSVDALAALMAVAPRTITRYTEEGIDLLTQRLVKMERDARRAQLDRSLYARLPYSRAVRLIGRDDLLDSVEAMLATLSPCHLLITGAMGVGKTVFAQELLRRQIAAGNLDQLVWIDQPGSVLLVRQQLAEQLLQEESKIGLRDYLLLYRVAVVIDEIDALATNQAELAGLLRDLGAALVCLISRTDLMFETIEAHLRLPELDAQSAGIVIGDALRLSPHSEYAEQISQPFYEQIGGNPLALKLAVGLWERGENWDVVKAQIHERLCGQMFAVFGDEAKLAWCALALFPNPVEWSRVTALWGIAPRALNLLLEHSLVEAFGHETYRLANAARDYLKGREQEAIRPLFQKLIGEIDERDDALDIVEQILISGFPEITRRAEWIRERWKRGLERGHWANWRVIFENYVQQADSLEAELQIGYGICLRRLADWESAQQVFYNVVMECGRKGRFAEQAWALVEWSILAKNRGEYERAQALITQAKRYAQRSHDEALLETLAFQEAQIMIQQDHGSEAYKLLTTLPVSANVLMLQSEAQFGLKNQTLCQALAERALKLCADDQLTEASLYTILGRSAQAQGNYQQAQGYLTDAVILYERLADAFALARAQTNLAAVLIPLERYTDADRLLTQAEQVQARLGDKIGLSATRHNRGVLGGHIAC